jgi:hypothetical protein
MLYYSSLSIVLFELIAHFKDLAAQNSKESFVAKQSIVSTQ